MPGPRKVPVPVPVPALVPGFSAVVAVAALFFCASAHAAPPLPASTQRYTLTAGLNPATHAVKGHASISLVNHSERPLETLVFHLYMNAFRDRRSVFMRESGGQLRGEQFQGQGSIELLDLKVDGQDLLPKAERELVPGDRTQLRVRLPKPLAVGARVQIESDFVTTLPPAFARAGYAGEFFAVTQWFPKLAKLEPDGRFASFPYHGRGEFYADFADYTLIVDTPESYVVGATGELANLRTQSGRSVRRFEARHVHDAAFVTSPNLRELVERTGAVEVHYLYPPGYDLALPEHQDMVRVGLAHFGSRYGAYPYPTLTVVLPPREAEGAAGMEYPTMILTAGMWAPTPGMPRISGAFVTAHELAHEWFYGLVATNEVRHPMLDEGLTEWASLDLVRVRHGAELGRWMPIDIFELERRSAVRSAAPPGLAANAFAGREYGASVYARTAIVLESIRRAHGKERFDRALSAYATEQRFAHPTPDDLGRNFDAVYGRGFAARTLLPLLIDGAEANVRLVEADTRKNGTHHRTHVLGRRTGAVALPTWVAAYDADGGLLARTPWPAHVTALEATFDTPRPVARIVADPDRALLVDDDATDQIIVLEREGTSGLFTRLSGLFALLLAWVGP
jgi:hypothetical protein